MSVLVKDIMSPKVRTVSESASIVDAAKAMARWKIGSLVITKDDTPVGIITEGDVSKAVSKGVSPKSKLSELTRRRLVTIDPGEKLESAAKIMANEGIKKLPVMDGKKLVGIVTQTDIVGTSFALVTSLKEMVQARYRPPDFEP